MNLFDTIAAVSTPYGKGGVAVIRVSGERAVELTSRVFKSVSGKNLNEISANTATYGYIYNNQCELIDDVIATVFKDPHSFTGEDTVEIGCHGGILITQAVLTVILSTGVRSAEAGEFTRRAFVAGKMGLSQVEALGELLDAKTDSQMKLAKSGQVGKLGKKTYDIYNKLLTVVGNMYAKIDFPDEDLTEMAQSEILDIINEAKIQIEQLQKTYKTGRAVAVGIKTVICGKTNVGKSSLYNLLIGYDAAIVTEIAGTTRDFLEETVSFGGITLRLCDTAGLRETNDVVEKIGVSRAVLKISDAELIIAVFDGTSPIDDDDIKFISELSSSESNVIAIINKVDKGILADLRLIKQRFSNYIELSAQTGQGKEELERMVSSLYIEGKIDISEDAIVTNARQMSALSFAMEMLTAAVSDITNGVPFDLCCADIENAMSYLLEIDGRSVDEDIVAHIFAKFCVGK